MSTLLHVSQIGACIVNKENKIVGIGYNGMPNGCSDDELPWQRTAEDPLDTKYPYGDYFNLPPRLLATYGSVTLTLSKLLQFWGLNK